MTLEVNQNLQLKHIETSNNTSPNVYIVIM